jgi:hypothetical protein
VEVGEPHALGVEAVEVRRLEDRVAVTGQVAIALVVGDNEDDVRRGRGSAEVASAARAITAPAPMNQHKVLRADMKPPRQTAGHGPSYTAHLTRRAWMAKL